MRCGHCQRGVMRLVRFEGSREIWQCRQCGEESRVLDCPLCEQRAVRRCSPRGGRERWACSRCQVNQYPCRHCGCGWQREFREGRLDPCDHCGAR